MPDKATPSGSGLAYTATADGTVYIGISGAGNGSYDPRIAGTGSAERLAALEIPWNDLNKVFVSHLHSDHVGDFAAVYIGGWVGQRVNPLRIWGPNSSKPEWGTQHFVDHQVAAYQWDLDGRKGNLQSQGARLEVSEVPHDEYAVVYEENGVKIASWPASADQPCSWFRPRRSRGFPPSHVDRNPRYVGRYGARLDKAAVQATQSGA